MGSSVSLGEVCVKASFPSARAQLKVPSPPKQRTTTCVDASLRRSSSTSAGLCVLRGGQHAPWYQ